MKGTPPAPARPGRMLARALRLRCPHCGGGGIFSSWFRMRRLCPSCRLRLDRGESDYFIGAYTLNLIVAELFVVAGLVAVAVARWPAVPWDLLTWGLALAAVPAPAVTYPFSRTVWLALDLIFRPIGLGDLDESEVRPAPPGAGVGGAPG